MFIAIVLFGLLFNLSKQNEENITAEWIKFQNEFNRSFKSEQEESQRFSIFSDNYARIMEHNHRFKQGLETYKMGITKFSDWTREQFRLAMNQDNSNVRKDFIMKKGMKYKLKTEYPESVDWREKGAVTSVKDEGACSGGDYAFAAAGLLEGRYKITTGILVNISVQNLLDCSDCQGCTSGSVSQALFSLEFVGIELSDDYPFEGKTGECRYDRTKGILSTSGPKYIGGTEDELTQQIAKNGPVAVQIYMCSSLQGYVSGIYSDPICNSSEEKYGTRYMLAVGYGTYNGTDYYILKNSWGHKWGEEGYIRLARNKGDLCLIADNAMSCKITPPVDS